MCNGSRIRTLPQHLGTLNAPAPRQVPSLEDGPPLAEHPRDLAGLRMQPARGLGPDGEAAFTKAISSPTGQAAKIMLYRELSEELPAHRLRSGQPFSQLASAEGPAPPDDASGSSRRFFGLFKHTEQRQKKKEGSARKLFWRLRSAATAGDCQQDSEHEACSLDQQITSREGKGTYFAGIWNKNGVQREESCLRQP